MEPGFLPGRSQPPLQPCRAFLPVPVPVPVPVESQAPLEPFTHLLQALMEGAAWCLEVSTETNDHKVLRFLGFHVLLGRNILEPTAVFTVTLGPPLMRRPGRRAGTLSPKRQCKEELQNRSAAASSLVARQTAHFTPEQRQSCCPTGRARASRGARNQDSRMATISFWPPPGEEKVINSDCPGW